MLVVYDTVAKKQLSLETTEISATWNEHGDARLLLQDEYVQFYDSLPTSANAVRLYDECVEVWRGFIAEITDNGDSASIACYGDIERLSLVTDYTDFFSTADVKQFEVVASGGVVTQPHLIMPDLFKQSNNDDALYITFAKNGALSNLAGTSYYFAAPHGSASNIRFVTANIEYRLPSGFVTYVQARKRSGTFVSSAVFTSDGLIHNNVFAPFYDDTDEVGLVHIGIRNETGGTYTNTNETGHWYINVTHTRVLGRSTNDVKSSTITAAVAAGTNKIVTPASMTGIYPGTHVVFHSGTTNEVAVVLSVTATTFVVDLLYAKVINYAFYAMRQQASTIITNIAADIAYPYDTSITATNDDVLEAVYYKENALEIVKKLVPYHDVYARKGIFYVTPTDQRQTYRATANEYSTTIDFGASAAKVRAFYENGVTAYQTSAVAELYGLVGSQSTDVATLSSGIAATQALAVLSGMPQSKNSIRGVEIRNQYDGLVFNPQVPAYVYVDNKYPSEKALKSLYLLREVRQTNENVEYTLDEYADTIASLLVK